MSSLLRTYTRSFERRPYLTLCVANGILMSVGDISAQMLGMGVRLRFGTLPLHRIRPGGN